MKLSRAEHYCALYPIPFAVIFPGLIALIEKSVFTERSVATILGSLIERTGTATDIIFIPLQLFGVIVLPGIPFLLMTPLLYMLIPKIGLKSSWFVLAGGTLSTVIYMAGFHYWFDVIYKNNSQMIRELGALGPGGIYILSVYAMGIGMFIGWGVARFFKVSNDAQPAAARDVRR